MTKSRAESTESDFSPELLADLATLESAIAGAVIMERGVEKVELKHERRQIDGQGFLTIHVTFTHGPLFNGLGMINRLNRVCSRVYQDKKADLPSLLGEKLLFVVIPQKAERQSDTR